MRPVALAIIAMLIAPASAQATAQHFDIKVGAGSEPTLEAALDAVATKAAGGETRATIDIAAPVLTGESIDFKWPENLDGLEIRGTAGNVIDGRDNTSTWLTIRAANGRKTNVLIHGLTVTRYARAVVFEGSRERPEDGWNGGNEISGMHFADIGSRGTTKPATAVLDFVNSRDNRVTSNTFDDIYDSKNCGVLHIVYLASYSSHNYVADNIVHSRCGVPFKIRDASNDNMFVNNQVTEDTAYPVYQEDYCNSAARSGCTKHLPECPSVRNVFVAGQMTARSGDAPSHGFYDKTDNGPLNPWCDKYR